MVEWLAEALKDSSHVVTANRRLARHLQTDYAQLQVANGKTAWRTPTILAYPDWLTAMLARASVPHSSPTRIDHSQSQLLWERALRREIGDPLLNLASLARETAETWARLHEWQVTLAACEAAARGKDKRLFVRAANNYASILANENWIDRAGMAGLVTALVDDGKLPLPRRIRLAGFDRLVPEVAALLDALTANGCDAKAVAPGTTIADCTLHRYENVAAEMRAAGAWVRENLRRDPNQRIGVVVAGLEQDAARLARLLREGLLPGWQNGGTQRYAAVNVSYGKQLSDYPAIAVALTALRWLYSPLSTLELSQLLRSPALGLADIDARARLELRLRQLPDRSWSPAMLGGIFQGSRFGADAADWLRRITTIAKHHQQPTQRRSPAAWAELFDTLLTELNWPGETTLNSAEYQLVNRWRDLLNDFARLELVTASLTLAEAYSRLATLAGETVFQPEADGAIVQLLGPLEAAGMRFDKLWIAGLTNTSWPPPTKPLALVSRDLQREAGMPDAEPQDTLDYAARVLRRLLCSAADCVLSHAQTDGDTDQVLASLVAELGIVESAGPDDPGWHATRLVGTVTVAVVGSDPAPPVQQDEVVSGGAMTIERQFNEPFAAFVYGRLGVRPLYPIVSGLAPNVRGNLLHDALHRLYEECPSQQDIAAWSEEDIARRVSRSVDIAFRTYERYADEVLLRVLDLEKIRARELLPRVIAIDSQRSDFTVSGVENSVTAELDGVTLHLRYDRIDTNAAGEAIILDYKTGRPRQLLDRHGEPSDVQLVVYALAVSQPVAGIGLVNVDSRHTNMDAAGYEFTPDLDWPAALAHWQDEVQAAVREIASGDVRISSSLTAAAARPLGLLSRYREQTRDS